MFPVRVTVNKKAAEFTNHQPALPGSEFSAAPSVNFTECYGPQLKKVSGFGLVLVSKLAKFGKTLAMFVGSVMPNQRMRLSPY